MMPSRTGRPSRHPEQQGLLAWAKWLRLESRLEALAKSGQSGRAVSQGGGECRPVTEKASVSTLSAVRRKLGSAA